MDFSDLLEVILLFIMAAKLISEEINVMSKLCYNESLTTGAANEPWK